MLEMSKCGIFCKLDQNIEQCIKSDKQKYVIIYHIRNVNCSKYT